ncbi:DUF397 domain-containing protein [Streptomyces sp. NPDC015220]|uniref:DUF397 domain-containing protein n=1 Tax=Streptomyces sp. NPDC015220 TaxID=3364947 RepID=UPI0036FA1834
MTRSSEPHWFKSSYSGGSGTECVECAYADSGTLIRDSKHEEGPVVQVGPTTWRIFVHALTLRGIG